MISSKIWAYPKFIGNDFQTYNKAWKYAYYCWYIKMYFRYLLKLCYINMCYHFLSHSDKVLSLCGDQVLLLFEIKKSESIRNKIIILSLKKAFL